MKTLNFSDNKRPILTFEAEHTEFARDGEGFVIQAGGAVTFQDTPVLEEILHGERACLLSVTEDGEVLMQGRFVTTFLMLEPDTLAVRLTVGE